MSESRAILLNELRYSERLTQRTARYYRHLQAIGTFATVVGGSATLTALAASVPPWVSVAGACAFAICGGAMVAIRPADKAAANEADMKRYAKLRTEEQALGEDELRVALNRLRETDIAEVESLRHVAYNDVMTEIGQTGHLVPLNRRERLVALMA